MNTNEKVKAMDMLIDYIHNVTQKQEGTQIKPTHIGNLNIEYGIHGYKKCPIGTPVFDTGDRYMFMLESLDGKRNLEMTFYKDTLKDYIDFFN